MMFRKKSYPKMRQGVRMVDFLAPKPFDYPNNTLQSLIWIWGCFKESNDPPLLKDSFFQFTSVLHQYFSTSSSKQNFRVNQIMKNPFIFNNRILQFRIQTTLLLKNRDLFQCNTDIFNCLFQDALVLFESDRIIIHAYIRPREKAVLDQGKWLYQIKGNGCLTYQDLIFQFN